MALQRLKDAAEKAKCELSSVRETEVNLPFIISSGRNEALHLQRAHRPQDARGSLEDLIERTVDICRQTLDDAHLEKDDIDEVVLVGGMTRMPKIQQAVQEFFEREPCKGVHPDESVALGAGIQGSALIDDKQEMVLLDVTPHALGIMTQGGYFEELIPQNTTVPTHRTKIFTTSRENQTAVKIVVMQGESERAEDNELLGEFILTGLRRAQKGAVEIEVTFEINADGIVSVHAKDLETGQGAVDRGHGVERSDARRDQDDDRRAPRTTSSSAARPKRSRRPSRRPRSSSARSSASSRRSSRSSPRATSAATQSRRRAPSSARRGRRFRSATSRRQRADRRAVADAPHVQGGRGEDVDERRTREELRRGHRDRPTQRAAEARRGEDEFGNAFPRAPDTPAGDAARRRAADGVPAVRRRGVREALGLEDADAKELSPAIVEPALTKPPPALAFEPAKPPPALDLDLADELPPVQRPRGPRITLDDEDETEEARLRSVLMRRDPPDAQGEQAGQGRDHSARDGPPTQAYPSEYEKDPFAHLSTGAGANDEQDRLGDMRDRFSLGDYTGALEVAESILAQDSTNADASRIADECRVKLIQMYTARIGPLDRVPMVVVAREQLRWLSIDHRAGFLLSHVDGVSSLEMILDVSGMPLLDALKILTELQQQRVIGFR